MLFLGSVISLPTWKNSGPDKEIPDVVGITKAVLSGSWKWNSDRKIFERRRRDEPLCPVADRCQRFLQRLTWRVSPYFNERRGDVNYEDLFYLTDQLRSTVLNPAIQSFVEQTRVTCGDLCRHPSSCPQWIE